VGCSVFQKALTEEHSAQSDRVMIDSPAQNWTPVWAMPNVTLDEPIETAFAALVPCNDRRLVSLARGHPAFKSFVRAFRDEFGSRICPTIGIVQENAPPRIKTVTAFGGFRDAVCFSAIVAGQSLAIDSGTASGVVHSDAFDVYPWFPTKLDEQLYAFTPALVGAHEVAQLRPQSTPALGRRSLPNTHIDQPLLTVLLARWERCYAVGDETAEDRRLFRALEMARAASRTPGGSDASEHDAGRAAALWVSAFEILAHDGDWVGLERVLLLINQVKWISPQLKIQDRPVKISKKKTLATNLVGAVCEHLYRARNDFIHGNPVTVETLRLEKSRQQVQWFAAPLFRLALTAFLDLYPTVTPAKSTDAEELARQIVRRIEFRQHQQLSENAILVADRPPRRPDRASTIRAPTD
jgi:hypothetical protein